MYLLLYKDSKAIACPTTGMQKATEIELSRNYTYNKLEACPEKLQNLLSALFDKLLLSLAQHLFISITLDIFKVDPD